MSSVTNSRAGAVPSDSHYPPRTVYDETGHIAGIILAYPDYQTFLKLLAEHSDWEKLPSYLQDAIDNMLADEAEEREGEAIPLRDLLSHSSELP